MRSCQAKQNHRKTTSYSLVVFSVLLIAVLVSLVGASQALAADGWVLTQRSEKMGDQYVYVSSTGFKWVNPKFGANVVTSAPAWGVTMFNDKTRSVYNTSFQEWRRQMGAQGMDTGQMKSNRWLKSGTANIAGLKATRYTMNNSGQAVAPLGPDGRPRANLNAVSKADCWLSDEITMPAQIAELMSDTYGLPRTKFFPLKVTYTSSSGTTTTALDTYRSQTCALPPSYFAAPKGYQLASSSAEVLMDADTKQILKDLVSDIDDGGSRSTRGNTSSQPAQSGRSTSGESQGSGSGLNLKESDLSRLLNSLKGGK